MVKDLAESGADKSGNKVCIFCNGTGQTGQFRGVSRFVISWEDCPDCHGTGIIPKNNNDGDASTKHETSSPLKKDKE